MSDNFWQKLSVYSGYGTLLAIFMLLGFAAQIEIKDLDLWLHLGMGRFITQNGFVPGADVLSCTIAGQPWINHEWLFQYVVYHIYRLWGFDGLVNMQLFVVSTTMLILLFLGYTRKKQLAVLFILLLVSLVYQGRFTIRPDIFSLLFFVTFIYVLSHYLNKKWSIWFLFVIQVLWTNMHGFFFFGPLFALIGLIAEYMKRNVPLPYKWNKIGRLDDEEYKRLMIIFGAVVIACVFNPLTFKGAWYPISVFFQISGESRIFFEKIIELKRPITPGTLFSLAHYPFYKLMILLSLVSFVYNREKLDIGVLMFWLLFLFFSMAAIRNMIFFAFAAYLVFVTNVLNISITNVLPIRIRDKRFGYLLSITAKMLLTIWIIQYWAQISLNGYFDFEKYERKSEFGGVSLRSFPHKLVDFLVENDVKGNFFNDFNSGAYLVGRTYPNIKVFIDGRTEVYGPEFFRYYQELWENDNPDEFAKMLDKYKITGALLNSVHQSIPKNALNYLYDHEEWTPVYFDYDGVVFLKDVPENHDIIERNRLDLSQWKAKRLDNYRIGSRKITPYQNYNRAQTLADLGLFDPSLEELDVALTLSPNYLEPYILRGRIFSKREEYRKAFDNFRIGIVFDPGGQTVRFDFANSYYDLGEYGYAVAQFHKILERWPGNPNAMYLLAKSYTMMNDFTQALNYLSSAYQADPSHAEDVLRIGDMIYDKEELQGAIQAYEIVVKDEKVRGQAHYKLGRAFRSLGDQERSQEELRKSLAFDPDNEEVKIMLQEYGSAPQEVVQ